jgi:hypothetical protein
MSRIRFSIFNAEELEDFLINGGFVYARERNEAKSVFI